MAEITVYDFPGLKSAIQSGTDMIYLGSDITFTSSGGAIIPRNMGAITIDGQGFTITDYNSVASGDTIRIGTSSGDNLKITIQNVVWNGSNYYGIAYVPDNSNTSNISLILNNVTYTGVQAIYKRYGITQLIDSSFSIKQVGTASSVSELGEVNKVIISGKVSVISEVSSSIYSIFWFPHSDSSFTVEDNAEFSATSLYNYMFYSDTEFSVSLGANSKSEFNLARGFFYYDGTSNHMASSFTLNTGASFIAKTGRTSSAYSIFRCRDNFVLEQDSIFYLETTSSGSGASIYFPTVANLYFNNPKSVVIYNNGGFVFDFQSGSTSNSNKINIDAELLNYWTSATPFPLAGTFEDPPTGKFYKQNGDNIQALLSTTRSTVSNIVTNIEDGDEGYPMTSNTFPILTAKVLSMGNIDLTLKEISDISTNITGTTEQNANLKASYNSTILNGTSSSDGAIDLQINPLIPTDTIVNFGVNWRFLTKFIKVSVVGSVSITYLPDLVFKTFVAPCRRNIINRKISDWYMEVTDTRTTGDLSDWILYASLPHPLTSGAYTLDNTLILRESSDTLMTPTAIQIKRQAWTPPAPIVTRITWSDIDGFLLKVDPSYYYNAGLYSSELDWHIEKASD